MKSNGTLFGKADAFLWLLSITSTLAALAAMAALIHENNVFTTAHSTLFAIAVGFTCASVVAMDAWLLMASIDLVSRCVRVTIANGALGIAVFWGVAMASLRAHQFVEIDETLIMLVVSRTITIVGLAATSFLIAPLFRFQLVSARGTKTAGHRLTIRELMIVTALIAIGLALPNAFRDISGPLSSSFRWVLLIELLPTFSLVLLPTSLLVWKGHSIRKAPLILLATSIAAGLMVAIVYFALRNRLPESEVFAVSLFWSFFAFGCGIAAWTKLAEIDAWQIVRNRSDVIQPTTNSRPRWNITSIGWLSVAWLLLVVGIRNYDAHALISGESVAIARHVGNHCKTELAGEATSVTCAVFDGVSSRPEADCCTEFGRTFGWR